MRMLDDCFDYNKLDPGISETVRLLRAHGFDTTDSGDGISKPVDERVFECLHVVAATLPELMTHEADRMLRVLGESWRVESSYCANDGTALLVAIRSR